MLSELLLHVGPEKTGTTTIQASLAASAPELTAAGTFVPLATGHSPGHHLPILRELVGDPEFQAHYAYSQDVLSLQATLAELAHNGCDRMVLSAEDFSAPSTRGDVLRLIQTINPAKLTVVHAIRPVVPWLLSWHGQDIKYGLFDRGCWPVDQFSRWFGDNVLTIDSTGDIWNQGPWDFELRTILLPTGTGHDIVGMFAECARLPGPLKKSPPSNQRLTPCELHLLQTLNIQTFDPNSSLVQRALSREVLLASLAEHGMPAHSCDCEVRLEPGTRSQMEEIFAPYVDRVVTVSGVVIGDPATVTSPASDGDTVHNRFPTADSSALCLPLLMNAISDGLTLRNDLEEARAFWQAQASDFEQARDFERLQAGNWQSAAGEFEEARTYWREQAQNWQDVAGEFEKARDFWHEQAQNWERAAQKKSG
jgi:hypothetical protein